MARPVVAIVGRPNVGKSALFNRLIGRRQAIVEETPGLTRDRLYAPVEWNGRAFLLVDTGGLRSDEDRGADAVGRAVREQTLRAVEEAAVLLFVVDAQSGWLPEDAEVAHLLRQTRKPVLLVANKVDGPEQEAAAHEFHALGLGAPLPVSALHGRGVGDLLDEVVALLPPVDDAGEAAAATRVAVVGRPNVGKSSLVNAVLGEERVVVAPEPGTTRDAVDTVVQIGGAPYVLVDTAGLRRPARVGAPVERYSVSRTRRALERADVAVLVVDAAEGVTDQDQRIARQIAASERGLVVALNKWDLVADDRERAAEVRRAAAHALRFVAYAPQVPVSATARTGLDALLEALGRVAEAYTTRVPTGPLNRVIEAAEAAAPPPADHRGRRAKILYATQPHARPPTIVLFVNDPARLPESYLRYLERALRDSFPFPGAPIRFELRARTRKPAPA